MIPHSAARDQLQFLIKAHQLERIVLFGHYGCAYYAELLRLDPDGCLAAQEEDLRLAAKTLNRWFTGMQIEAYMAMRNGERVSFRPVAVG